ncbi:MAG: efflux RND transporter periplasmic adaptor subunit, partial [Bacteroidota bacterium]
KTDFNKYATIQGMISSDDVVMASSETGGRLTSMVVKEGQNVRRGQLIATVDMESVNKQIAEIEKSLELAKSVYERQDRLWKQNIGSEIQYLQAKNNKERLEKSLETVKFQLTKANVYAPISGVVDREFLMSGEMAGPGAPIVQILNTYNVKVVADVPENYLISTKRGQMVDVYFPALDEERRMRITLLGRSIDPSNRTFKIEMKASNKNGQLKPNLLAEVKINDLTEKDVIVVPLELVQQEVGGKNFIYTVGTSEDGQVANKVYVSMGESYDGNVIITEGLDETMEVIIDGARNLANGELLEIQNPETENNG